MFPEDLAHLSYIREQAHGHIFIVRCQSADRAHIAGRLSYVPDLGGAFRIDGRPYRKVGLLEQSANTYPLISHFARDAVHMIPADAIDHVWDPFTCRPDLVIPDATDLRRFFEELTLSVDSSGGRIGLIGSRLVASSGVEMQADFDMAVYDADAWISTANLVDDWIRRRAARMIPDQKYAEFHARRMELGLGVDMLNSMRRGHWWRKLGIGSHIVSLSCATGLGLLPAEISEMPAEVEVDLSTNYVAGTAPYVADAAISGTTVSGALHLSWFLRQGFRGTVKGRLAEAGGRQWVWVSKPEEVRLTA